MIKYTDTLVTFKEIPNEISLAINLSNCPFNCNACHSPQLQHDIGNELSINTLKSLIDKSDGISCILFLGGDSAPNELSNIVYSMKCIDTYSNYKYGWYSGSDYMYEMDTIYPFDYYKVGSYNKKYGALNEITTNQRLYKIHHILDISWNDDLNKMATQFIITNNKKIALEDITYKFWNKQYK